ncbi:MAG: GumC family protein [Mucilaginibacter sp.]
MEETNKIQQKLPNQEFDYIKMAKILISRWYWIAASVLLCYIAADVYLWYTPKMYAASSSMKLEDKKTELSDIVPSVGGGNDKNASRVQTETFVIQSRAVILNAVKDLNYPISFYIAGRVRTSGYELYPEKPLDIKFIKFDSTNFYHDMISFKALDQKSFKLSYKMGGTTVTKTYPYNNPVDVGPTTFSINNRDAVSKNSVYLFNFNSLDALIGRARGGLGVSEVIKNSNIVYLRENDANPQFASDILNAIMKEYVIFDRSKKQQSSSQIISFIDNQLDTISKKVRQSETAIEDFKQNSKLMDVASAAQVQLNKSNDAQVQRSLLQIQLRSIEDGKQQIISEKSNSGINFMLDPSVDVASTAMINNFNNLIADKNSLLKTYTNSSQPIKDIDRQIAQLKGSLLDNIAHSTRRINEKIQYLNKQIEDADRKIGDMPVAERKLASLNRDFEINEKVYTLLSEKKLDAQISRSAIAPGATIIEQAQPNFGPVSPDERSIRRSAIITGLLIGLGLIILIRILNPYIYDKETVESLTTIPIIGVIRKFPHSHHQDTTDILVLSKPRSIFAESVRSVRTNLSFLASEKSSKVICITSEVAGEGKSFVAVNLSTTLSLIDKKVILIAADLRRSKLHKTFAVANEVGLSGYLSHQSSMEDIIVEHPNQPNLDFIPSGPVPPNPSELLHSSRMQLLLDQLRLTYDIIMIDTAPVGLVSDSIPLIRLSDINVFVIRSGKSKFYSATIPQRIDHEYNLNNSVIILNAFEEDLLHSRYYTTKFTGENYGSRYYYYSDYSGYESSGYYVDSNKKKWWDIRRWF